VNNLVSTVKSVPLAKILSFSFSAFRSIVSDKEFLENIFVIAPKPGGLLGVAASSMEV
jgi:hypothetical protein